MNLIKFSVIFVILNPIYRDIITLNEFQIKLNKYEPIIERALEEEIAPSTVLNNELKFICISGCYQDIDSSYMSYILRDTTPLNLSSQYLEKEYVFYRI